MAKKDEYRGANLKPYEERLLNDPNVGEALKRGERVRAEDLPMDIKREMDLERNQYVNFKPDVLAQLGLGQVTGGRGRKRFVPTAQQIEEANITPAQSIQDILTTTGNTMTGELTGQRRTTPYEIRTTEDIKRAIYDKLYRERRNEAWEEEATNQLNAIPTATTPTKSPLLEGLKAGLQSGIPPLGIGSAFLNSIASMAKPRATSSTSAIIPETGETIGSLKALREQQLLADAEDAIKRGANANQVMAQFQQLLQDMGNGSR